MNGNEDSLRDRRSRRWTKILERAKQGNEVALGRLVRRYYPYMMQIAVQELPRELRGRVGASDVVQEALVRLQLCLANFGGASEPQLRMWLRRIVRNCIGNARRHHMSQRREVRRERNIDHLKPLIEQQSPSRRIARREMKGAVAVALGGMPPLQRQVLYLRHCEARSFAEISSLLNRTPDATRMIWWRALRALRQQFHELQDGAGDQPELEPERDVCGEEGGY